MLRHLAGWLLAALLLPAAWADTLVGRVISVADGDTLTLLAGDQSRHVVRLAGIDAPEKDQPHGTEARANLMLLTHQRDVMIEFHKRDRYGRFVGKILLAGQDINLEQIRAGLAWHYKDYQSEQTRTDQAQYAAAEAVARADGKGLWGAPRATPPWEWRQSPSSSITVEDAAPPRRARLTGQPNS